MTAETGLLLEVSDQRKRWPAESCAAACPQEERQTMSVPELCSRQPRPLAAGVFQPEIGSFRLCLAAEGARIVRISHQTALILDRYIRVRARHAQAYWPQLWMGASNRGPMMTANGIYQMIARRGRQCGVAVYPHRFRHHFSHTWLDRGGAEGDLMELNGWTSPQMLRRYGASTRSTRAPQLRPHHGPHPLTRETAALTLAQRPGSRAAFPLRGS